MKFELNDRVRIIENGQTGSICDVNEINGKTLYIVDSFGECESDETADCLVTVEENEIEPLCEQRNIKVNDQVVVNAKNDISRKGKCLHCIGA